MAEIKTPATSGTNREEAHGAHASAEATGTTQASATQTSATHHPERAGNGKLVGIVFLLTAVICLMLLSFLAPAMNSGPKDLPLAVSGPQPVIQQLEGAMEQKQPGAFEFTELATPDEATQAVKDREAIGAINASPQGVEIVEASGAGTPYKQLLTGIVQGMEAQGQKVTITDVAPTTSEDPTAIGLTVLALPLAFGGMASASILTFGLKHRRWGRVVGSLIFSALAGLAIAAIMQFGFHNVEGNYLEFAGILSLGIAGTSMFVLGMESLFGAPGLGIGAIITIFLSNPLSGIGTGWQWLPSPWGAFGQFLPIGAAGNAARSVAFFDGAGMTHSVVTLFVWIAVGCAMVALSAARKRRAN